jgi:hypothetical protein
LKINKTLLIFNLKWNNIAHEGAYTLAEALKENEILERLDLQNNEIYDKNIFKLDLLRVHHLIR